MIKANDDSFELQGRASRVVTEGIEQDATVFTAFAGQVTGETLVQLELNPTKDGVGGLSDLFLSHY